MRKTIRTQGYGGIQYQHPSALLNTYFLPFEQVFTWFNLAVQTDIQSCQQNPKQQSKLIHWKRTVTLSIMLLTKV